MLLLGVGIGSLRVLKSDGPRPHGFIWNTDRVKKVKVHDPAHYIPLVCGEGPHYQSSAPRDSGAYYNPLVCGGGPHYQSRAPRDSGAYYNPLVCGEGFELFCVIFVVMLKGGSGAVSGGDGGSRDKDGGGSGDDGEWCASSRP